VGLGRLPATQNPPVPAPPPPPQPLGAAYLRLVAIAAAIGIPAALVGAGFLGLVHELEGWLWSDSPSAALVIGLPVLGALIVIRRAGPAPRAQASRARPSRRAR
jgi:hypothetical protein